MFVLGSVSILAFSNKKDVLRPKKLFFTVIWLETYLTAHYDAAHLYAQKSSEAV